MRVNFWEAISLGFNPEYNFQLNTLCRWTDRGSRVKGSRAVALGNPNISDFLSQSWVDCVKRNGKLFTPTGDLTILRISTFNNFEISKISPRGISQLVVCRVPAKSIFKFFFFLSFLQRMRFCPICRKQKERGKIEVTFSSQKINWKVRSRQPNVCLNYGNCPILKPSKISRKIFSRIKSKSKNKRLTKDAKIVAIGAFNVTSEVIKGRTCFLLFFLLFFTFFFFF